MWNMHTGECGSSEGATPACCCSRVLSQCRPVHVWWLPDLQANSPAPTRLQVSIISLIPRHLNSWSWICPHSALLSISIRLCYRVVFTSFDGCPCSCVAHLITKFGPSLITFTENRAFPAATSLTFSSTFGMMSWNTSRRWRHAWTTPSCWTWLTSGMCWRKRTFSIDVLHSSMYIQIHADNVNDDQLNRVTQQRTIAISSPVDSWRNCGN